jgi:predicted Rossmann fold nucleotide-binding protein DprA/Smf involved in DNA uptake
MPSDNDKKAALKQLRQERRQSIKNATAAMKAQRKTIKAIQQTLAAGAATVPEIAEHTRIPTDEVLWFIATMKKYGQIVEDGKDGGYYRYAATEPTKEEQTGDHP